MGWQQCYLTPPPCWAPHASPPPPSPGWQAACLPAWPPPFNQLLHATWYRKHLERELNPGTLKEKKLNPANEGDMGDCWGENEARSSFNSHVSNSSCNSKQRHLDLNKLLNRPHGSLQPVCRRLQDRWGQNQPQYGHFQAPGYEP